LTGNAKGVLWFFGVVCGVLLVVIVTLAATGHSPKEGGVQVVIGIFFISFWSMLIAVIAGERKDY
jgi:RsiW-degrading membrane proteinase PrsW (M82 family)